MKKVLLAIILGFLVMGLTAPLVNRVLAIGDQNLNACCKISTKFTAFHKSNGATPPVDYPIVWDHKKICIAGEKGGPCVINGKDYSTALTGMSGLKIDNTNKIYTCGGKDNETDTNVKVSMAMEGWGLVCLLNTVYNVTNWIFYLMLIAIVLVFVLAGVMFMMAGGDMAKTKNAKGMMILGIVGLVIALIAKLIPSVVRLVVGM